MKKIKIIIVLFILGKINVAEAQEVKPDTMALKENGPFSVYINGPLGFITKVRAKVEYRFKRNQSVLLSFAEYHGIAPGLQTHLEYRKYYRKVNKTEFFYYGKAGAGKTSSGAGKYGLLGAGVGQSISFGKSEHFSIQFTEGLRFLPVVRGDVDADTGHGLKGAFYLAGPGAIVDLGINLGWRF